VYVNNPFINPDDEDTAFLKKNVGFLFDFDAFDCP
jgi:hypothetical protein